MATVFQKKYWIKSFNHFLPPNPPGRELDLGLSLSYDIVKAHGGEIKVESNPDSKGRDSGTIFSIELPG